MTATTVHPRSPQIERALAGPYGGRGIASILTAAQLTFITEDDLQAAIKAELDAHLVYPDREVRLSDGHSRIDLLAGRIGIEVKIKGGWADVIRQLTRYAHCDEISALVLVTTKARHHSIPTELAGKPVSLVSLIGSGL